MKRYMTILIVVVLLLGLVFIAFDYDILLKLNRDARNLFETGDSYLDILRDRENSKLYYSLMKKYYLKTP